MKYFLETEFIEYPCTIDLMSIGLVSEDGREYYAINRECDFDRAEAGVKEHLIGHADPADFKTKAQIRDDILAFVREPNPEFWGYYADYHWVVFCWLFGPRLESPKRWPLYCRDIKQWCDMLGDPDVYQQGRREHHALADARWNRRVYDFLVSYANRR